MFSPVPEMFCAVYVCVCVCMHMKLMRQMKWLALTTQRGQSLKNTGMVLQRNIHVEYLISGN